MVPRIHLNKITTSVRSWYLKLCCRRTTRECEVIPDRTRMVNFKTYLRVFLKNPSSRFNRMTRISLLCSNHLKIFKTVSLWVAKRVKTRLGWSFHARFHVWIFATIFFLLGCSKEGRKGYKATRKRGRCY